MQTYGQFSVFPRVDQLPIWRDRTQGEPVATADRRQRLNVVRREGDFYCIRMMGIGYGYVRADDVISEYEARKAQAAGRPNPAYAASGVARVSSPIGNYPDDTLTGFEPVGFFERLLAYLIDVVALFAIYFAIAVLLDVQRPGFHNETVIINGMEAKRISFTYWAGSPLGIAASAVAGIVYWIGGWLVFGASAGKMILGQRIVDAKTGGPIGIGACIIRYIGMSLSAIPLFLGYLWIIWDSKKQAWHDKMASTLVVRTR